MEANISLMELLEDIQDPRNSRGKRHPLSALLALAIVGMLAGMTSYQAIVEYGKQRGWEFLQLLGFTRRRGLCKATYSRVFRRIDAEDFETKVGQWIQARLGPDEVRLLNLDGKTARGSRDGELPGVHLLAAFAPEVKAVLGQLRVDAKTNEHKAALELLGVLPLEGKVVTGDAMFTHRDVCTKILEGGGDYILPVKDNQPTLKADIEAIFAEPEAGLSPPPDQPTRRRDRAGERTGQGAWSDREANDRGHFESGRISGIGLARLCAGLSSDAATQDGCEGGDGGGLWDHQPAADARGGQGAVDLDSPSLEHREPPVRRPAKRQLVRRRTGRLPLPRRLCLRWPRGLTNNSISEVNHAHQ